MSQPTQSNKMHSTTSETTAPPERSTLQASSSTSHSNSPAIATTKSPSTSLLPIPSKVKNSTPPAKKAKPNSPPMLLLSRKDSPTELLNIDNMPVPKIGTTVKDEKKNLLNESSSAVLDIENMPVPKLGTTLKEAKNNFLNPTITESKALLTLQNRSSSIPTIPPMPKTVDLPLIAPDKTSVKKEKERNNAPFVECAANVCSTRNCKSTVTRLKHPNSSNKYKLKQYTCLKCYTSEKVYQSQKHSEVVKRKKFDKMVQPLLGWTQQKALVWHRPHSLPKYLDEKQVIVGTFGNMFAFYVLSLCRLARSNSFTTAKSKMANDISNNRGTSHGGYTTSGPNKHWKNENHAMLGGREPANSTLMVIEFILNEVRSRIPETETSGNQYVEK